MPKHTNFFIWCKLCLNPYSEQIICMSNANTRISTLALCQVIRLFLWMAVCQVLWSGLNLFLPYSPQLTCKYFVIIWISLLVKSLDPEKFMKFVADRLPLNIFQQFYRVTIRKHFLHRIAVAGASYVLVTLFTCVLYFLVSRVWVLDLQPISAMYALGSWLGPSVETRLKANNIKRIYTEYGTKTIIEPTETTGIYSFVFFLYVLTMSSKFWRYKGWNCFNGILSKTRLYRR